MPLFNPSPKPKITFQQKIETPFEPQPEAYFLVNDIAQKVITNSEIPEKDSDFIKNLFLELQNTENQKLVDDFIYLKNKGIMNSIELGIIGSFFMIARTIGPKEVSLLEQVLIHQTLPKDIFQEKITSISIPESIKKILIDVYSK